MMCVDIFIQYIIKYIIQNRKKIKTINMETNKNMETINKAINSLFAIQKQLKKSQLLDQSHSIFLDSSFPLKTSFIFDRTLLQSDVNKCLKKNKNPTQ